MTFEEFIEEWRGDVPFITAHTSGSTGTPKEIILNKEFVRRSACRTNSFFHIGRDSRLHSCVSPEFIGGKMMAVRAEEASCRLTWETPSNVALSGIRKDDTIDLLAVVPSQMLHIVSNIEEMPHIGAVIIGGSAINPRLREKIAKSGLEAYETYGMTETASHIALRKVEAEEGEFCTLPGISVGVDERGCLAISFDSGERIVTNDLATVYDGRRFIIDGRYDHVIITGGKKVNPFDVERRIGGIIDCPFVISSLPDEKWGSRVVLKLEGLANEETSDDSLIEKMKRLLHPWEVPKEIIRVEKFTRTSNGKIRR